MVSLAIVVGMLVLLTKKPKAAAQKLVFLAAFGVGAAESDDLRVEQLVDE